LKPKSFLNDAWNRLKKYMGTDCDHTAAGAAKREAQQNEKKAAEGKV
jgi:hypothetical protein